MKKLLFTFMLFSAFSLAGCNDKNAGIDDINDNAQTETPDNDNNTDNGDGKDVEDDEYFPYTTEEMFPDPIFRAYILKKFDTNKDGKISKKEAEKVESISSASISDNANLASFEGIQYFTNLKSLQCYHNKLTSLNLSQNTALEYLSTFQSYNLTTLDVSGCTALRTLNCNDCHLATLDASGCTALRTLYCIDNYLTTLDVSGCTALYVLDCSKNYLPTLDVSGCTALYELRCYINQLTELYTTQNPALTKLWCYHNQLTKLDVTQNTALETLYCQSNQLTELDVTQNTALTYLICSGNQLTTLDVSKTNLGKGTSTYPLDCSPMNGSGLETLYLKTGRAIEGINLRRDNNYVPANTKILYKD